MLKKLGDLYWHQLSKWDFSETGNIDAFTEDGFHYELLVVKEVVNDSHWKVRNVTTSELTLSEVDKLKPEPEHNWHRVMGNELKLVTQK